MKGSLGSAVRRNPMLGLPSVQAIVAHPGPIPKSLLRTLCYEAATDARGRSDLCWRRNKAPMAAYWRAVSVYWRHTARAIR